MRCHGIGPAPCTFMGVAEAPGWQEDQAGIPLVGKTGDLVRTYFDGLQLPDFDDVFWTNLYRQYEGKDHEYTREELARDEPELLEEFQRVQPQVVITMGRHSTRYFLGDVDMEDVHGLPWAVHFRERDIVVFACMHPAAGFHNPEVQALITYDFQQLSIYLQGGIEPRVLFEDPYAGKEDYGELTDEIGLSMLELPGGLCPSIDTEGWARKPWSLQYSVRAGSARLVAANQPEALHGVLDALRQRRITYHNSLHDLWVIQRLCAEAEIDWDPAEDPFDDTMVMAYLLQVEPKGLKSLGVRFNGMQMDSYESLIHAPSRRLALHYLGQLHDLEARQLHHRQLDAALEEVARGRRIKTIPKLPKTRLHKAVVRCLRSADPRALWENQDEDIRADGLHRLHAMPEATLSDVPRPVAVHYGCRDADCTFRLKPQLQARVEAMGLQDVYHLELSTYPLLLRMMQVGMLPDLEHFKALSWLLQRELNLLQAQIETITGRAGFNANSGDQVSEYLFETLGLPGGKETPSHDRYSTNDRILEALERLEGADYPIVGLIRTFRELYKLKHTFVDQIPDFVNRWPYDGRIHTTLRTTSVVTGRLAASDPNLLAQPERGKWAWGFKRGWRAAEGHVVTNHDQSQIELRVLAHLAQDPVLMRIFRGEDRNPDGSKIDPHSKLVHRIFGGSTKKEEQPDDQRVAAKEINFGLAMGMQAQGLCASLRKDGLDVDEDDAQKWIDDTMSLYVGVPVFQRAMVAEARRSGSVRCMSGRIRYIGGIHSRDRAVRAEAERFAFSTPIQEGAQTIMKHVEAAVWQDICVPARRRGEWLEPLLQVHDALKFEMARNLHPEFNRQMVRAMTETYQGLSVPLEVDGKWGDNFDEMEHYR